MSKDRSSIAFVAGLAIVVISALAVAAGRSPHIFNSQNGILAVASAIPNNAGSDRPWPASPVRDPSGSTNLQMIPCATFTNATAIIVPSTGSTAGPSSPYSANIPVAGLGGTITSVTVKLKNFNHTFADDVDVLLVGPGGQNAVIMSDVGGENPAVGITLTLDDEAVASMSDASPLTTGTFKPTNVNDGPDSFTPPAPTPTGSSPLSVFNGTPANGTWSLYVIDDAPGDIGNFNGGWELSIGTSNCSAPQADVGVVFSPRPPTTAAFGDTVTFSALVNNNGPEVASGVVFDGFIDSGFANIAVTSGTGCTVTGIHVSCAFGNIDPGPAGATSGASVRRVTFTAKATQAGSALIRIFESVNVTNTVDPNSANSGDTATVTVGPAPSVQLIGLEVTQAVQDLANSVPLVADKRTFVRAHVRTPAGLTERTISASLVGTNSGGVNNGRLSPSNPGRTVMALRDPKRNTLIDSFYFELPSDWIRGGTLQFRIESNDSTLICQEPDATPNCATAVTFNTVRPFSIKLLSLKFTDVAGVSHTPGLIDTLNAANEMLSAYPISSFDGEAGLATTKFNACLGFSVTANIRTELNNLRNADCKTGSCKQYYQGLLADQSSCSPAPGANGESDLPGSASVVWAVTDRATTRVHELGHGLGLRHVDYTHSEGCGDGAGNPIPCTKLEGDGTLSLSKNQFNINTAYGINSSTMQIFPAETADFMSYAGVRWPSRQNYVSLYNKMTAARAEEGDESTQVEVNNTVQIDGGVLLNGTGAALGSVSVSTTPGTVTLPSPGEFAVRLENAQGTTLATYSFDPIRSADNLSTGIISLLLPWDTNAKRIVILYNGQVLATRQASANSPTVTVTSPNGGETLNGSAATLSWTSGDTDGNSLTYNVDYSVDNGATWKALAVNWNTTSFPFDPTKLPGSNQALFLVTASDGLNSAQDQSNSVFTVPPHAPEAAISTPENNRVYVGDQTVNLNGIALDTDEGFLAGSRLGWSSNLNGQLGTGNSLTINAMALQEGTHTITLTATDSTARVGIASISIRVFRIRPTFPAALSVGPTGLVFSTIFGPEPIAPQPLAIRNVGDGDLPWTATADQPWILLAAAAGTAPANSDVNIDQTNLPPGNYHGTITVAAGTTPGSPKVVNVDLSIVAGPPSSISGRVLTPNGLGLRNAIVSFVDSQGVRRTATTSSFGVFSFAGVADDYYTISISSKRYRFAVRTVQVSNDATLTDFVGLE